MNLRTLRRIGLVAAITAAVPFAVGDLALGTPGSGAAGTVIARGTADEKIKSRGNAPYDVVIQTVTIQPGGHTGWHSHPGQAIVVVRSGALTIYDGDDKSCSPHVYTPADVLVDNGHGHVHIGRNEGTVPVELHVTYIEVPVGGAFRIDAPRPGNCTF